MTTEKMIEVMKAYTKGKPIEYKMIHGEDNWADVIDNPSWDWLNYEYRIKSEIKQRLIDHIKTWTNSRKI